MLSDPSFDLSDADEDCVILRGADADHFLAETAPRPRRPTPGPSKEYLDRLEPVRKARVDIETARRAR